MLIYMCCAFSLLELAGHRSYWIFCAVLISLFVYIAAERNIYVVPDTYYYVETYSSLNPKASFSDVISSHGQFEPGWMVLNLLCRKAGLHYRSFLGLVAFTQSVMHLYIMNQLSRMAHGGGGHCVNFSLWVSFWGMVWSGIILRIGMALPFAFLAHVLTLHRRYVKASLSFLIAFTFHYSILVYLVFLYLSSLISMRRKNYDIYGMVIVILWLINANSYAVDVLHDLTAEVLKLIAASVSPLARYQGYIGSVYNTFSSRKNFLFIVMLVVFIYARPRNNQQYDHWLKFFAFNLAMTFPLSSFVIGYRVSDICLISALPLLNDCMCSKKFSQGLRMCICIGFIVSMFIFSLRMTGVS